MTGRDLTCKELVELVTDYLENTLAPSERERFELHLNTCPGCATYLEQMRATIAAVGSLAPETLAPDSRDALLQAFRDWHAR